MPLVSERGRIMPDSPIRKLAPLADQAKERGLKVYHLNIGQPDLPTPPEALEAIKNIDRRILEYTPSEGIRSFREKLVKYYHRFRIDVSVEDIIITTGGSEAVTFAFMSCLDPGDEILVPEPAYANYEAFAIVAGAVIKSLAAKIEDGFALPPVEEFEKLITPKTKGIMICNPNNPTGRVYVRNRLLAFVRRADGGTVLFHAGEARDLEASLTPLVEILTGRGPLDRSTLAPVLDDLRALRLLACLVDAGLLAPG